MSSIFSPRRANQFEYIPSCKAVVLSFFFSISDFRTTFRPWSDLEAALEVSIFHMFLCNLQFNIIKSSLFLYIWVYVHSRLLREWVQISQYISRLCLLEIIVLFFDVHKTQTLRRFVTSKSRYMRYNLTPVVESALHFTLKSHPLTCFYLYLISQWIVGWILVEYRSG